VRSRPKGLGCSHPSAAHPSVDQNAGRGPAQWPPARGAELGCWRLSRDVYTTWSARRPPNSLGSRVVGRQAGRGVAVPRRQEPHGALPRSTRPLSQAARGVRVTFPLNPDERDCTDLTARLGAITASTLILTGDADTICPPAVGQFLCERIPRSRHEIVRGGGHDFAVRRPEEVAEIIRNHVLQALPQRR